MAKAAMRRQEETEGNLIVFIGVRSIGVDALSHSILDHAGGVHDLVGKAISGGEHGALAVSCSPLVVLGSETLRKEGEFTEHHGGRRWPRSQAEAIHSLRARSSVAIPVPPPETMVLSSQHFCVTIPFDRASES